jgi:hypothetical protein
MDRIQTTEPQVAWPPNQFFEYNYFPIAYICSPVEGLVIFLSHSTFSCIQFQIAGSDNYFYGAYL